MDRAILREFLQIESAEKEADQHTWWAELLAQRYGAAVDHLWNTLNASTNGLVVLRDAPLRSLACTRDSTVAELPHGIVRRQSADRLDPPETPDWRPTVSRWIAVMRGLAPLPARQETAA